MKTEEFVFESLTCKVSRKFVPIEIMQEKELFLEGR